MYPHFLGIGAQKAGTTWLAHNLALHPEVWMPPLKEIHYFDERLGEPRTAPLRLSRRLLGRRLVDRRWRKQVRARSRRHLRRLRAKKSQRPSKRDLLWDLRYYMGGADDRWYGALFEPGRGLVAGEITPAYSMLDRETVARAHTLMPEAKILFMVRNPIERAWSQAVMQFTKAEGKALVDVREQRMLRNFASEGSLLRTGYLRTLETWGAFYPEDRIFVGFLEDVSLFPEDLLERAYSFLGVDPAFKPPGVEKKVHSRTAGEAPARALVHLARLHREEAARLEERFGGYAGFWRFCAERLSEDPPGDGPFPYPLWESPLWEEWVSGPGAAPERCRSGVLSDVLAGRTG